MSEHRPLSRRRRLWVLSGAVLLGIVGLVATGFVVEWLWADHSASAEYLIGAACGPQREGYSSARLWALLQDLSSALVGPTALKTIENKGIFSG